MAEKPAHWILKESRFFDGLRAILDASGTHRLFAARLPFALNDLGLPHTLTTGSVFAASRFRAFCHTGRKWQVSTNGGVIPRWRRDGK